MKRPLGDKRLSFSGGISNYPVDSTNKQDLFQLADRALYFSKFSGKNKITITSEDIRKAQAFHPGLL